jgi:class 3 adenylate cyclase/tetratricopeptide (TPR) repeat protein
MEVWPSTTSRRNSMKPSRNSIPWCQNAKRSPSGARPDVAGDSRWPGNGGQRKLRLVRACSNCGRQNPDDAAFCMACATSLEAMPAPREQRKVVTVVFCDVIGSTALGERLDPESLRDVQSRYFGAMRSAIERHEGTVEKYIGDAVMAVFGIPQVHEDDALRAVRAATDMREALVSLNKEIERDRGVAIQVRTGVNTGEVVTGNQAAGRVLVTGDTVNVAARLEQHAEPGEVLLGEATHRLVRNAVDAEPVESIEVKGKAERVRAWRLIGVREVTSAVHRHLDSPMVGRKRHLAQLRQAFDAALEDASCQLFTLLGAAGVGKSRLVEEFVAGLGEGTLVLSGRCLPYGEGITYFPVVEAIKQAAGLADFDLPDVVETKVRSVLEGDEHQEVVCRHVSQLMGVAEAATAEETFWAIRRFFEAAARERPLVLVFDDVHWGEPTFLDLVEHISDWSRGSPILIVCMARPDLLDVRPAWSGGKLNAATVSLEPLSDQQSEVLIMNLLGSPELSPEIRERIVETAEGNPLFVEETLAMLIDDGVLIRKDGRWAAAGNVSDVAVPPSIQALLAARLDRLTFEERMVIEAAAVVGKDFVIDAVRHLVPERLRSRVPSNLMALVRKELIRPERATQPGEDAFRFRHLAIRDAAYDTIAKTRRTELHELIADWLERTAGDAVVEQEEIVGYHLEQAYKYRAQLAPADERSDAIGRRAATRLLRAGRRASDRGDNSASANLLQRALSVGPSAGPERAATLYDLGVALREADDARAALAAFDEAFQLAARSGDSSLEWLARLGRSEMQAETDPHSLSTEAMRKEFQEAIRRFEELEDETGLATAWRALALLEHVLCRFDRAERAASRAVRHARVCGDDRLLSESLVSMLASKVFGSASPEEGYRTLDLLVEDVSRFRSIEAWALLVRGAFEAMEGSFEKARRLIRIAMEIQEALGSPVLAGLFETFLGEAESAAGDAFAAEHAYRRGYEILDEFGYVGYKSTAAAKLAHALCTLGRSDEAAGFAAVARSVAAEDDLASQVLGRSAQARVLSSRGSFEEAEQLAREAVEMFLDAEAPGGQGDVRMDLAEVLRTAGKSVDAEQVAREALAFYERKGNRVSSEKVRDFLAEMETHPPLNNTDEGT